jgi:1-deoxyxylulose-5-phosphate synthase
MKYRYLGNSELNVSVIGLGTYNFNPESWGCDEYTATDILNAYLEKGGNFIDTADKYGDTLAEKIIGRWLKSRKRDDLVIATKCFFKAGKDIKNNGLSRKHILKACEASLRRLQTDYIDLYQLHIPDPKTPLEETMSILNQLVKQGKVRYTGLSNFPAWKVMKTANIAERFGFERFISGQYLYNLLKRDIEIEVIPACEDVGMKILCWAPLSGGMLTGKYKSPAKPPNGTRLALCDKDLAKKRYAFWFEKSRGIVAEVRRIAKRYGKTPAVVSIAWLLKNECVASVITGARTAKQITDNSIAGEWELPLMEWKALDTLSKIDGWYPYNVLQKHYRECFGSAVGK